MADVSNDRNERRRREREDHARAPRLRLRASPRWPRCLRRHGVQARPRVRARRRRRHGEARPPPTDAPRAIDVDAREDDLGDQGSPREDGRSFSGRRRLRFGGGGNPEDGVGRRLGRPTACSPGARVLSRSSKARPVDLERGHCLHHDHPTSREDRRDVRREGRSRGRKGTEVLRLDHSRGRPDRNDSRVGAREER